MDYEDSNKVQHLLDWITTEQAEYLQSVIDYKYSYTPELAKQLEELELIIIHGRLLIPTQLGRDLVKLYRS